VNYAVKESGDKERNMNEGRIYQAVSEAMKDIEPIAKSRKNAQQNFRYRGIDDVMNELQPILVKHGIFIVPEVLEQAREERVSKTGGNLIYSVQKTAFHFIANDGSKITAVVVGEGMDSGDKASNKALSVAFKYACLQIFCIPTEDAKDPDGETPPPSTKSNGNAETSLEEQRQKIVDEMKTLTKEKTPDGREYFTEDEVAIVKNIVNRTGAYERGIKILLEQRDKLKADLKQKKAALEQPVNDGFADDIPF
jgi:hypothetical protein